jgi:hypothetical protein
MKTYTMNLIHTTEGTLGRITIQAIDWEAANLIAKTTFSNSYIEAWIEEEE